jgi:chitin disaccharide deacetylase
MKSLKKIIITGDDFGLAQPVNEAIIQAHQEGMLTSASLMVGEPWSQDAVDRAKKCPALKVGLHLTLVEGRPVSRPQDIPDLVDANGEFSTRLVRAGFNFFFMPGVRKQLATEIRAQFEAFWRTGLSLDHADAHNHMHLHPTILGLLVKIGQEYGLKAVRVPNEPPIVSWKASGTALGTRMTMGIFLAPWIRFMKYRLRRAGITYNDYLFGMTDCGAMTTDLVRIFFQNLPEGISEFCFHPASRRCKEIDTTMPNFCHEEELLTLLSPSMLQAAQQVNAQRITYSDLRSSST